MAYFTSEHFKLLNKWKGQKRDASNPEQNRAYKELAEAYKITEEWANQVCKTLFLTGSKMDIRKSPMNRGNFIDYNWAKIYPRQDSPKELAYTLGIDADSGFIVKIDTVGLDETSPLRKSYLDLRGTFNNQSPIIAIMPAEEGLQKSLTELVDWSVKAIQSFKMNYDTVAEKLGLIEKLDDFSILKHFDSKPPFKEFRSTWSPETTTLFCRIVRATHSAGLDWWHMGNGIQVRFGRKRPGNERAIGVFGILRGKLTRTISIKQTIGDIPKLHRQPITEELVSQLENAFSMSADALNEWQPIGSAMRGYWPYELQDEPLDPDDAVDDEEEVVMPTNHIAFNRIYYGPPGTGKTYELQRLLDSSKYTQRAETLTASEWTDQQIAQLTQDLTWWEILAAALYDLGGRADVSALMTHAYVQSIVTTKNRTRNVRQTIWGSLQQHAPEDSKTVKVKNRIAPYIFDKTESSEWFFVGDWQEQCSEILAKVDAIKRGPQESSEIIRRYEFVTFHQSYGYEEFVEGLRPVLEGETGELNYEIRRGTFLRLCERARKNPAHQYAMVIDEINRGNISKIFGELITLIEIDKREDGKYPITLTLPYSGEAFSVPSNVDVIGTMNTADRSLALVDTALRRRFEFVECMPKPEGLGTINSKNGVEIDMARLLETINNRIEALYDRDHTIGHAYFTQIKDAPASERFDAIKTVFKNKIIPLLEEYFFEDWQKIRLVLGDNQKPEPYRFVEEIGREVDLESLFGRGHELDQYAIRSRYQLNPNVLDEPQAYVGIYDAKAITDSAK